MNLTLYHQKGSRSQRVLWLLEELGINYKVKTIDLFKGEGFSEEHLRRHPLGLLPVLEIDGQPMFESGAILQWLADQFPEKGLAPAFDSPLRRDYYQWMYFSVTNLEMPAWEIILHEKILPKINENAVTDIIPFATESLVTVMEVIDKELENKTYMLGDRFSAVDIMVAFILIWFPRQVNNFANIKRYINLIKQRPAYLNSQH
jgi:glutathione S-transferase